MDVELRFAPATVAGRVIQGVAMRYGDVADINGAFSETVASGAFAPIGDVILTVQHERDRPLARTEGGGLELIDTPKALTVRASLPETRDADDALELLSKGILRGFSVAMIVDRETFSGNLRRVHRAQLSRIGLVDRPAYGDATARVAQRMEAELDAYRQAIYAWL